MKIRRVLRNFVPPLLLLGIIAAIALNFHRVSFLWNSASKHAVVTAQPQPSDLVTSPAGEGAVLPRRGKTVNCKLRGNLPDPLCTPGEVDTALTSSQLCAADASPTPMELSSGMIREVYLEYGITSHKPRQYEINYLVPLELGGTNGIANLWPLRFQPAPGVHEKRVVEQQYYTGVCSGNVPLAEAQKSLSTNWVSLFTSLTD